jgi:AbiV family abortive infection protein
MEQAGHLLHDALALYKLGRYASAILLSILAREEIGRSVILLGMRKDVIVSGSIVSAKAVIKACDNHGEKLRRGRGGITFEFGPERSADLKGLFDFPHNPQSEAFKKAHAIVDDFVERKARRDPGVTHQKRMRALYVEPTDTGWNRPCETGKEEASRALQDAANAYGPRYNNLYVVDEALAKALAAWKQCPTLPEPIVPPAPWC